MDETFKQFPLMPEVHKALDALGFIVPTEIQAKSIPLLLSKPKMDLHGQAQTGTGKTLAFGIPLLHRIDRKSKHTQAVVVAPTRELALQICDSIRPIAEAAGIVVDAIYGGASIEAQIRSLRRGVHIVVGTPGRINDHLARKTLILDKVSTLVLDEADIMLDMGFKDEIDEILRFMPSDREIWLFSATVKSGINDIMISHMKHPESIRVSKKQITTAMTQHYYCIVPMRLRLNALCRFIESAPHFYGFIFCQTKMLTAEIAEQLLLRGYRVGALHGDMSQSQRNAVIKRFKAKEISILVATDVAARGIDIANVTHVINHSLSDDSESYVHRTGRTGRAGREGIAITFINKSDVRHIAHLQRKFNLMVQPVDVPSRETIITARMQEIREYVESIVARIAPEEKSLNVLIDQLTEEQRRNALRQILFDRFLKSIFEEEEFTGTTGFESRHERSEETGLTQEIYLPIGSEDGVDHEAIMQFISQCNAPADAIVKVRVIKRRTFIHVMREQLARVMDSLQHKTLGGRKLRAILIDESSGDGGNSGQRRRFDQGRSGGFGRSGHNRSDRGRGRSGRRDYRGK